MWLILFHNLAPIQAAEESYKNSNLLYFQLMYNLFFMLLHFFGCNVQPSLRYLQVYADMQSVLYRL